MLLVVDEVVDVSNNRLAEEHEVDLVDIVSFEHSDGSFTAEQIQGGRRILGSLLSGMSGRIWKVIFSLDNFSSQVIPPFLGTELRSARKIELVSQHQQLDAWSMNTIAAHVTGMPNISSLCFTLTRSGMVTEASLMVPMMLQSEMTKLTEVQFNCHEESGAMLRDTILVAVANCSMPLTKMILGCGPSEGNGPRVLPALLQAIRATPTLEELVVEDIPCLFQDLTSPDQPLFRDLVGSFSGLKHLRKLEFHSSCYGRTPLQGLLEVARHNDSVKNIRVVYNRSRRRVLEACIHLGTGLDALLGQFAEIQSLERFSGLAPTLYGVSYRDELRHDNTVEGTIAAALHPNTSILFLDDVDWSLRYQTQVGDWEVYNILRRNQVLHKISIYESHPEMGVPKERLAYVLSEIDRLTTKPNVGPCALYGFLKTHVG